VRTGLDHPASIERPAALRTPTKYGLARSGRHRLFALTGVGFFGGVAIQTIPIRHWSRAGTMLFGAAAWFARSPIAPLLLAVLSSRFAERHSARNPPCAVAAESMGNTA